MANNIFIELMELIVSLGFANKDRELGPSWFDYECCVKNSLIYLSSINFQLNSYVDKYFDVKNFGSDRIQPAIEKYVVARDTALIAQKNLELNLEKYNNEKINDKLKQMIDSININFDSIDYQNKEQMNALKQELNTKYNFFYPKLI